MLFGFTISSISFSTYRKSACPFGGKKTKMYLPESPSFKYSLAGASGQVLMLVHVRYSGFDL